MRRAATAGSLVRKNTSISREGMTLQRFFVVAEGKFAFMGFKKGNEVKTLLKAVKKSPWCSVWSAKAVRWGR